MKCHYRVHAILATGVLGVSLSLPVPAQAQFLPNLLSFMPGAGSQASLPARKVQSNRPTVSLNGYSPGTVVIRTNERRLYYVVGNGRAVRYTVGVGRPNKQWTGQSMINGKYIKPAWSPPEEIRRDNPRLPNVIPSGATNNPMGAAALTLSGGEYAIHGTNRPGSVGGFVSYGCFRMHNSDILDLFDRVAVGTPVVVER